MRSESFITPKASTTHIGSRVFSGDRAFQKAWTAGPSSIDAIWRTLWPLYSGMTSEDNSEPDWRRDYVHSRMENCGNSRSSTDSRFRLRDRNGFDECHHTRRSNRTHE